MNFTQLEIQNFLTFKKATINLKDRGLVLVLGENVDSPKATSNGAGKSTILDAICWCLWGKTSRDLTHDEVVNRFVKKNCVVSLSIELDNGTNLVVTRTRKDSASTKPNDLRIYVNGVEDASSTTVTQEKIIN